MIAKTLIAVGLLGLSAVPALAQDDVITTSRAVSLAGLDLATSAGQAGLDARLRHAARAVCNPGAGTATLAEKAEASRCFRTALRSARTEMALRVQHNRALASVR